MKKFAGIPACRRDFFTKPDPAGMAIRATVANPPHPHRIGEFNDAVVRRVPALTTPAA